ncbi:MAG: hypothetical protein H6720_21205 [Sandaracinus sp.]|nr:hypothetical protein [Myxococcales bacterium]MCB9602844.1 hypothetical protein [Sandaracinus sp.]
MRARVSQPPDEAPLRVLPTLGALTLACALLDLVGRRLVVRVLGDRDLASLSHDVLVDLGRGSNFVRNLAAFAGLIALGSALTGFLHPRAPVPTPQRVGLAGFAGIFLPTIFLSAVLPVERTTPIVVLVACGASSFLAIVFALGALRWRGPRGLRVGAVTLAFASFLAFAATVFLVLARLLLWDTGYAFGMTLRRVGEVGWLATLVLCALVAWPSDRSRNVQVATGVGAFALAGAGAFGLATLWRRASPELYADLVYGATHLELGFESLPVAYPAAVLVAMPFGLAGLVSGDSARRFAGGALLFLATAGFAPTTPLTLLFQSLAVVLLARALVGEAMADDPEMPSLRALEAELDAEPTVH